LLKISDIIKITNNVLNELSNKGFLAKERGRLKTIEEINEFMEDFRVLLQKP
jgi:hypothetical protein